MKSVKVFPNGQVTISKDIRKRMDIKTGDTLLLEEKDQQMAVMKGKTIFNYIGHLPDIRLSIEEKRKSDRGSC